MPDRRPDLRLDAPTLEPSDDLVFRLAMAARSNASTAPTRSRGRRLALVVGSFLGVSVISVGGAWAVGAIDVPLLPPSPLRDVIVTPTEPPPRDRQDGGSTSGGGADLDPAGKVVTPAGADRGSGAGDVSDSADRSPSDPAPKDPGDDTAAPVDQPPAKDRGQGDTRSQDKGDNGQHRGQDKDPSDRGSSEEARERGNGNGNGDGNGSNKPKPEKPSAKPEKDKNAQAADD